MTRAIGDRAPVDRGRLATSGPVALDSTSRIKTQQPLRLDLFTRASRLLTPAERVYSKLRWGFPRWRQ